jgi:plastocyanin
MRIVLLGVLAHAALALAPSAQTTHDVTTSGFTFLPADITIQMGDTVRWTMAGPFHTVTDSPSLGAPLFDTAILPTGGVFEFTFDEAAIAQSPRPNGVYDYFCTPHVSFGMIGSVTVQDIPLVADALTASASSGGTANFQLDGGASSAGLFHLLVGSATGTSPGLTLDGQLLPLNFDSYLVFSLQNAGGPIYPGTTGFLDGSGQATAAIVLPGGLNPGLVGSVLDHAWAGLDLGAGGIVKFTSNPVSLVIGL